MKPITLFCIFAAIVPSLASAQTTPVDTVKVISTAQSVTVTRQDNKTIVTALIPADDAGSIQKYTYEVSVDNNNDISNFDADEFRLKLPFTKTDKSEPIEPKSKSKKTRRYVTGLKYGYWGWNFNYHNKTGIKNAFEVGVADIIGIDWCTSRKTTLGVGIGFGYSRVTSNDYMLFAKDGDALTLTVAPENAKVDFARWDTWHIHVPLMYSQKLTGDFGFALATIINFNTYATATNRYTIDRTRYTETIKGLNQRLLTVDVMASVGLINYIGFYAKWSPMTSMQSQYGPSFRNFSIGVNVNF